METSFRQLLIQIAVVGIVVFCFGGISEVCAQSSTGFLYIDCGATIGSVDPVTGIKWVPDTDYISTGVAVSNVPDAATGHPVFAELGTLRYFNNGRAKNCYTLPVTKNGTYLLRVSFYHGSYDGATSVSFQLGIDATTVNIPVEISDTTLHYYREFTIQPQKNVIFVCLMPTAANSNDKPFISGISLRPVSVSLPPRIMTLLAGNEIIYTPRRYYFGTSLARIRYPDDVYDRVWFPRSKNSTLVSATAPILDLTTTGTVSIGVIPKSLGPPLAVLKSAITTSGNLTISLPAPYAIESAFLVTYFAELDPATNITDRRFMIHVPDVGYADRYENPLNYSGLGGGDYWAWGDLEYPTDFAVVMYPLPTSTSLRGPLINALEMSYTVGKAALPTSISEVTAIEAIKSALNLTGWSGDPCRPYPHTWLNCSDATTTIEANIVAVYLSNYNLSGAIPSAFGELRYLTILDLQNNSLTGSIPASLASMPTLRKLYVQYNNLSGLIPAGLNSSNNLDFRYEGNPWLGKEISPSTSVANGKKSNVGLIIGVVVGGLVALLLVTCIVVYFCCFRNRTKKETVQPQPQKFPLAGPSPRAGPSLRGTGARAFPFQSIVDATNNFTHEIGKGGFGSVYYGQLPDGQEIAVKVLDKTSVQGSSEFKNEVEILSRVHHKNLVAMVGYCEAGESPMLVYEFVHNGSLRDHLSGIKSFGPDQLDWKMRVSIALNAAQGLEYLHTSCIPSFIHRDVKSSNVLLTTKFVAKIADFGLSRLVQDSDATRIMTQVKGTPGYLDPEYCNTNMLSPKTDVFSFGVVLLELITGRLPIDQSRQAPGANLCDWVRHALEGGDIDVILDPAVRASTPKGAEDSLWKVAEIAMRCVEPRSFHRPAMTEVVQELQDALQLVSSSSVTNSSKYSDYSSGLQQHTPDFMPEPR